MIQMRLLKPSEIRKEEVPAPEPGKNEILIRVAWCGICGSDVHAFHGKHPFISTPIVQGHEFSGIVSKLGEGVSTLGVGDRVTVEPSIVDGRCPSCRAGRYNICRNLRVLGCQLPGAFAEYVLVPAEKVYRLPQEIALKEGVLVEPLAVGIHAVRRARVTADENVIVVGAGTIGLMTMMAAKATGCKVLQTDVADYRLRLARECGADFTANAADCELEKEVEEAFGDKGADVIFECAGTQESVYQACRAASKGTRIVMTAVYTSEMTIPMGIVQDWELELIGTLMYMRQDYETALRYLQEGNVRTDLLITHEFQLEELAEAYRAIENPSVEKLKVVIKVSGNGP